MTPSTVTSRATLDLFCADNEAFSALTRISNGCPLPENVLDFIDPFHHEPKNLPDGFWYYVNCNGNADSSFGHWKLKGGDCKLCSNSPFTGWRNTYEYYEGQAPHEHKTAWVLQKYWMSQSDLCENSNQKGTSSLCKVFIGDELFQNHEKIQKIEFSIIPNSETVNLNHQLVVPDGSINMANGSTSKSEMSEDDKMVGLTVAGKSLDHHLEKILSETDYVSRGDFLELRDLDNPASPSSSFENSSCSSMSSDEYFDWMALLRDIEHDNNLDTVQRETACISSSAPTRLRKEVVHQGASESLVSIRRSHSEVEEDLKTNSTGPGSGCREPELKLPNRLKGEASSSSHNKMMANGKEIAVDGGKKKTKKIVGRMKRQKKYFCFFFSF